MGLEKGKTGTEGGRHCERFVLGIDSGKGILKDLVLPVEGDENQGRGRGCIRVIMFKIGRELGGW